MRKLFLTAICILCSHWLWSGEIWVSPKGNDFNDGTRQSPKATLTAALRQAREWRRTGDDRMQGGITVYMEGGTYALYEPVFIRPEDSGTKESPTVIRSAINEKTVIRSAADEKVVLSGGVRIKNWKKQGKLWVADVPTFNGRPLDFRQLWVNGEKAVRARDVEDFEKMNRICSVDENNEVLYVPAVAVRRLIDNKGKMHRLAITVLPEVNQSYILMSCLDSEEEFYRSFFQSIKTANLEKILFYFNLMLPLFSENVILSEALWNALDEKGQFGLTHMANLTGDDQLKLSQTLGMALRNAAHKKNFDYSKRMGFDLFQQV